MATRSSVEQALVMETVHSLAMRSTFSDEPLYNVKAVCTQTGISAATLRAWERRYGLPMPTRTAHGYRLYSQRDVALVVWLLHQTENGINIGQAVNQLTNLLVKGAELIIPVSPRVQMHRAAAARSPEAIRTELMRALLLLDERATDHLLNEATALYTLETTLINVLREAVQGVLALRARAEAPITAERFALNYSRQRLLHLIQTTPSALRTHSPVVTIGFPRENNELDLLIIGLLLRRAGWAVIHLGNELEPMMAQSALNGMQAGVLLYYTDAPTNAAKLMDFALPTDRNGKPIWCVYAGKGLPSLPEMQRHAPFQYLGSDLRQVFANIANHLEANSGIARTASRRAANAYHVTRPVTDK